MPISCRFTLNGMSMSVLRCSGVGNFPAFSGQLYGRDNSSMTFKTEIGPLPKGRYFIVGRESGGRMNTIRMAYLKYIYGADRGPWFALYRDDGKIDDWTFVDGVRRGNFRLPPNGPKSLSEGCVTLFQQTDFDYFRSALLKTTMMPIKGSSMKAYGTIMVD